MHIQRAFFSLYCLYEFPYLQNPSGFDPPTFVRATLFFSNLWQNYVKSILIFISPTISFCLFSGTLSPTRSSISLLASSWTYSLFALSDNCISFWLALIAPVPITLATCSIMYLCTCGNRSVLLATTLPASPFAYPAFCDASFILQPVVTSVSTKACCFDVGLRFAGTDMAPSVKLPDRQVRYVWLTVSLNHSTFLFTECSKHLAVCLQALLLTEWCKHFAKKIDKG